MHIVICVDGYGWTLPNFTLRINQHNCKITFDAVRTLVYRKALIVALALLMMMMMIIIINTTTTEKTTTTMMTIIIIGVYIVNVKAVQM